MPRREISWTKAQWERLQRDAQAADMSVPDWIRFCCLRAEPGRQMERARRERTLAGRVQAQLSPPKVPGAAALARMVGVTEAIARSWLEADVVTVDPETYEILVRGVGQKVRLSG